MTKKPLTFSLEQPSVTLPPRPPAGAKAKKATGEMKQVGARIPESLYRQLKAHAALTGERVQTLLEVAVSDYLRQHGKPPGS